MKIGMEYGYRETDRLDGYDPYSKQQICSELVTHSYKKSFFTDGRVRGFHLPGRKRDRGGDFANDRIVPDTLDRVFQAVSACFGAAVCVSSYRHGPV